MRRTLLALSLLMAAPLAGAAAQQGQPPTHAPAVGQQGTRQTAEQQRRIQRQQEMLQEQERLMEQIRATNRWMEQHENVHARVREMGQQLEQAGEQLRLMQREMIQLHQDPAVAGDRDQLKDMDRLRDRIRDMQRDMDRTHQALQDLVGEP